MIELRKASSRMFTRLVGKLPVFPQRRLMRELISQYFRAGSKAKTSCSVYSCYLEMHIKYLKKVLNNKIV